MADNYQIDLTLEEIFGTGISSIEQTTVSTIPGGVNVWTVTLTNGNSYDFNVMNGTAGGDPIPALTGSAMTDTSAVYLYLGSETGYTFGHWYYYNGAWTDGGAYGAKGDKGDDGFSPTASVSKSGTTTTITITDENGTTTAQVEDGVAPEEMIAEKVSDWLDENITEPTGVVIDTSLQVAGAAADSKKVGDEITDLKSAIQQGGGGMSAEFKAALENLVNNVAFIGDDPTGQTYINALHTAMYPPANLTSISAVYTQSGTVYDTDSLDDLKADLVVTAHYSNSTTEIVTTYTLSGTLTEGASTITVSYGGKTTTFNVTVTASPLPTGYVAVPWVASLNTQGTPKEYALDTGVAPSANGTIDIEIGFMMTAETTINKYFIAGNQGTGAGGAIGCGVCVGADNYSVSAYNGIAATITPNGTNSMLNEYVEVTAHMASGTTSITDGTLTDTKTGTGRQHNQNIRLFGLAHMYNNAVDYPAKGRVYYARVKDNDTLILDLLPCVRTSDDAPGFYDTVNETFITSSYLTAGE